MAGTRTSESLSSVTSKPSASKPTDARLALHVRAARSRSGLDLGFVAVLVHDAEHLRLRDRAAIVVGEQRRDRRRAAAEVVLLPDRGAERALIAQLP